MKKMIPLATLLFLLLTLNACILYRPDVQQGNVITPNLLGQVSPGMTQEQVRYVLGTPILINTFDEHTLNYVYTFQGRQGPMQTKRAILQFSNGRLSKITQ